MTVGFVNGIANQSSNASQNGQCVRWDQAGSVRYYLGSINAKNTGATTIFTTNNNGQIFYPSRIRIIVESANTITVPAIVSVGTVAGSYIDILPATTLTALVTTSLIQNYPLSVAISSIAANTAIAINVATGATATTLTIGVEVFGDYK